MLGEIFCCVKLSLHRVKSDGTVEAVDDDDNCAPIDMIGSCLFEKVDLTLNDIDVDSQNSYLPVSNSISNILSFTGEQRKTLLRLESSSPDDDDPDQTIGNILLLSRS